MGSKIFPPLFVAPLSLTYCDFFSDLLPHLDSGVGLFDTETVEDGLDSPVKSLTTEQFKDHLGRVLSIFVQYVEMHNLSLDKP